MRQECYMSQSLRSEATSDFNSTVRAEHEFHCSNTASLNHKVTTCIFSQQRPFTVFPPTLNGIFFLHGSSHWNALLYYHRE